MTLHIKPLATLEEALALALIRNECRHMMTNDQREISPPEQKKWFETFYARQDPLKYRVWVLKENHLGHDAAIGYFAAKEEEDGFYITEGVLEAKRGMGAGSFMLRVLISEENFKDKPIYADIFKSNHTSIRLHEKFDFKRFADVSNEVTRFAREGSLC